MYFLDSAEAPWGGRGKTAEWKAAARRREAALDSNLHWRAVTPTLKAVL